MDAASASRGRRAVPTACSSISAPPRVSDVVAIEDAMGRAWPALETVRDEAWLLRASGGLTRRGDSVLARPGGTAPLAERIGRAEAFAGAHGERTLFQLSPASEPGLEGELARRGYVHEAPT